MGGAVARAGSATEVCMLDNVIGRLLPAHEPDAWVGGAPNAHGTQADERREVLISRVHTEHEIKPTHQF